jgi:ferritin-like metal-binding protein YciE
MAIGTLEDLFVSGLRDIYYAEKQIVKTLGQHMKKAQSDRLREALEKHRGETETQIGRLEQVMEMLDQKPRAKKCPGIEGILAEAKEHLEEIDDEDVRDAALIGAAQAVEHYEISRYGTLIAWARHLGHEDAAEMLEETLSEEKATDELMTELAETEINIEAADEAAEDDEEEDMDEEEEEAPTRSRRKVAG